VPSWTSASAPHVCSVGLAEMYRDEPLDDEAELRALCGDAAVDELLEAGGTSAVAAAIDAMRLLQGWVEPGAIASWLVAPQRRLGDLSPLAALALGGHEDVEEALRAWIASQS
jgi:hypothetical protein